MAYRQQELLERCGVCEGSPTRGCARCNAPCCATHRSDSGRCAACELASYERGMATRHRVHAVVGGVVVVGYGAVAAVTLGLLGVAGLPLVLGFGVCAGIGFDVGIRRSSKRALEAGTRAELPPGPTPPTP